jgi:serine/threonine protein kinase
MKRTPGLPSEADHRLGTILCGKYRLDSVLGVGGMATVYAATHRNQAELAIKILHGELDADPSVRTRFLREAYAANSVKHRSVVKIVDDDVAEDGSAFLVMERLHGAPADELLWRGGGALNLHAAVAIVDELLDVLAAAHAQGVIHRDVKPANVFVTTDGEVKVLDFGIARIRETLMNDLSLTGGAILGTPAYMAPEQALPGVTEIDERTDVWGTGATLFTLLSGENVHDGDSTMALLRKAASERGRSLAEVAPRVPRAIVEVVDCALAFENERRWATAREMQTALRAAYRLHFRRSPSETNLAALLDAPPSSETPTRKRVVRGIAQTSREGGHAKQEPPSPAPGGKETPSSRTSIPIAVDRSSTRPSLRARSRSVWAAGGIVAVGLAAWVGGCPASPRHTLENETATSPPRTPDATPLPAEAGASPLATTD